MKVYIVLSFIIFFCGGSTHSKFIAHSSALFSASKKLWPNAIPPSIGIVESLAPFI